MNVIRHKLHEKWTVWWRPVEIEGSEKIIVSNFPESEKNNYSNVYRTLHKMVVP